MPIGLKFGSHSLNGNMATPAQALEIHKSTFTMSHGKPVTAICQSTKDRKCRTPPGHRVLHLVIPTETFIQLHKSALDSNMKSSNCMNRFLEESFPCGGSECEQESIQQKRANINWPPANAHLTYIPRAPRRFRIRPRAAPTKT